VRTGCLLADPGEQVFILHQGFLTEAAGHMQHIELLRVGQGRIRYQMQTVQIANRLDSLAVEPIGRVGSTRQHFERSGEVDLIEPLEEQRANLTSECRAGSSVCLETTLTGHR